MFVLPLAQLLLPKGSGDLIHSCVIEASHTAKFIYRELKLIYVFFPQVKIWFQNRRMKWKRSKKAQQEEKNGKKDGKDKSDGDKMDDEGQV